MTLVYHGTSTEKGIKIARSGAILSPLEQEIEILKLACKENPNGRYSQQILQAKNPEEMLKIIALKFASSLYAFREVEYRVKCLSVVKKIEPTKNYALNYENYSGGLVLGIEMEDISKLNLMCHSYNKDIVFIPRKLSLDTLKELYLSPRAFDSLDIIKQEFEKYSPKYFNI